MVREKFSLRMGNDCVKREQHMKTTTQTALDATTKAGKAIESKATKVQRKYLK